MVPMLSGPAASGRVRQPALQIKSRFSGAGGRAAKAPIVISARVVYSVCGRADFGASSSFSWQGRRELRQRCRRVLGLRDCTEAKPRQISGKEVQIPVADKTLTCRDCGKTFAFTTGEQEFYQSRGLMNEPTRCPECRAAKRQQRSGGGYGGGSREMFTVTCAACGKETQVPFQPRQDRPVYCSDCYSKTKARR